MTDRVSRLIKNTWVVYIRMIVIMGCTFYCTRILLRSLGVDDFGIYNVISGLVLMFSFVNTTMTTAVQRFLAFALGRDDAESVCNLFSMSITIHAVVALLVLVLGESIGLWFLLKILNIPEGRLWASHLVYQAILIIFILKVVAIPYSGMIIAKERMSLYSGLGIVDIVLQLLIIIGISHYHGDRLILFSLLGVAVAVIMFLLHIFMCRNAFPEYRYHWKLWDRNAGRELLEFCGWSFFGAFSNVISNQCVSLVLNIFLGVIVNAALGIATQVSAGINSFVSSFQAAFKPQLIKIYSSGDQKMFVSFIFQTSKISFFLLFLLCLPVLLNIDFILKLWLVNVPEYTAEFCIWIILYMMIDAISAPLWISAQALGKIRNYQLIMSFLIFLNLPLTYMLLKCGFPPVYAIAGRFLINCVTYIVRILYLSWRIDFPGWKYVLEIIGTCGTVALLSFPLPFFLQGMWDGFSRLFYTTFVALACAVSVIWIIGLRRAERQQIRRILVERTRNLYEKHLKY